VSDLTPTPERPGLHVSKPSPYSSAQGSFVCGCGDSATAHGDTAVKALVDDYTAHQGDHGTRRGRS